MIQTYTTTQYIYINILKFAHYVIAMKETTQYIS